MKYIIDVEKIEGTCLWKAVGFNTLVFDAAGLNKLEAYKEEVVKAEELHNGDVFKTKNGTVKYRFCGLSDNGKVNAVNIDNGCFTTVGGGEYRVIERL